MGRVCLILPAVSASDLPADRVARCRRGLEADGHSVHVVAVIDPGGHPPTDPEADDLRWHRSPCPGLSSAVVTGLIQTEGMPELDYLIVLDLSQGYNPDDFGRLLEPLDNGEADLVVASRSSFEDADGWGVSGRGRRLAAAGIGRIARPLLGVSDPCAGLLALTPVLARVVARSFKPVGSRFAIDLLSRSSAQRVEVPVRVVGRRLPAPLQFADLRNFKRLADDRYGNASRLIQFCAVGASGMIVDLTFYALLQLVLLQTRLAGQPAPVLGGTLDLAAAGAISISLALTWNFSLNRRLTFNDARDGSIPRQFLKYAVSNALGIALSLSLRLTLPAHVGFFQRHKLAAAVVGIVTATGISFSMARWLVFSQGSVERDLTRRNSRAKAPVVETSPTR